MANTYKIYENQSWADVSNHIYGKPDYSFELAFLNGSSVTAEAQAGMVIIYNEQPKEELVIKSLNGIPATEITHTPIRYNEGIDFWEIGENFEIQ